MRAIALLFITQHFFSFGRAEFVFTKELFDLSYKSLLLNAAAFDVASLGLLAYENGAGLPLDYYTFYEDEPDVSITAKWDGYCFGVFRGSTDLAEDWYQNFRPGFKEVCNSEECCIVRDGFYSGWETSYESDFIEDIRSCVETCENPDECLVLSGYSQGAAVAAVASLVLADLNPRLIAFGMPRTVLPDCPLVDSDRWLRFANSAAGSVIGITYDPVPFTPGLGAIHYGHLVILSEDSTGVAYVGLDEQHDFHPIEILPPGLPPIVNPQPTNFLRAPTHLLNGEGGNNEGYLFRLQQLLKFDEYPVRSTGYHDGYHCSDDVECMSGRCRGSRFPVLKMFRNKCVS